MKKYILAIVLGFGIVLCSQVVYAQTVDKNILADKELMKTITPEQLEEYISQGADVNTEDDRGDTPIVFAALFNSNPEVITVLAKYGADVNEKVGTSDVPIPVLVFACATNPNPKVIQTLIDKGAVIETVEYKSSLLNFLAENENMEKNQDYWNLRNLISQIKIKDFDKNILTDEKLMKTMTPEKLEEYISQGADVNAKDALGATPLMLAAQFNENPKIITILLRYGADINAQDSFGINPLKLACIYNNTEVIKILVANSDSENVVDSIDWVYSYKMKKNCENVKSPNGCKCMIPIILKKLPFAYKLEVVLGNRNIKKIPMEYFDETDFLACAMY